LRPEQTKSLAHDDDDDDDDDKGKGKVVTVLLLTEHHAMKAYWGVVVYLHSFSTRWR
jgi:hypothetical protein